jgi:serine phosphatase RsbU (regulator of sigma subunit)
VAGRPSAGGTVFRIFGGKAVLVAGSGGDLPRLAAVIERQRRELARLRAEADTAAIVAMARGVLMERNGSSAGEAALQLTDMAAAASLPLDEMAAAVLGEEPRTQAARPPATLEPRDPVGVAIAERARDGAELIAVLAEQLRPRFGTAAIAVWLLEADAALEMLGADGLGGTESARWRRLPPQFDCAEQRVAAAGGELWWPAGPPDTDQVPVAAPWGRDAARAVLPLRDRTGTLLGVAEAWWQAPREEWDDDFRAALSASLAGFAEVLGLRMAEGPIGSTAPSPVVFTALDQMADSLLLVRPVRDEDGEIADFAIMRVSLGYTDPAGRPAGRAAKDLAGLTLLQAYPASMAGDGLFARARRVLDSGRAEHEPGPVTAPLTGDADLVRVADLHAAPFFAGVVFTWRTAGVAEQLADLLGNAERLGQMGGWEEDLSSGTVRWTEAAFALFGLDPRGAAPIPTADLHNFVITADRGPVRRFRQSLLQRRQPAVAVFRIVRPDDMVIRQLRIFAEPVVSGDAVVGLRGAFQDVSAHYHTEVALAATRDQLADTEQRAAEDHLLALRLQRAIMPADAPPVEAAGVDVAVRYRPAEPGRLVAGDWYDAVPLPGKDLLLVVGDITGHGIDAVTGMVAARNALRGLAATGEGPAELLRNLNYAACHLTEGVAGTVVCGRYDQESRVLRWARAGHLPPILVREGTATTLPLPGGMLLGLDPTAEYEEAELALRAGDALLLFTDGLIERRAGSISDALRDLAAAAAHESPDAASHADQILSAAISDTGDDACLVVVRIL